MSDLDTARQSKGGLRFETATSDLAPALTQTHELTLVDPHAKTAAKERARQIGRFISEGSSKGLFNQGEEKIFTAYNKNNLLENISFMQKRTSEGTPVKVEFMVEFDNNPKKNNGLNEKDIDNKNLLIYNINRK